MKIMDIIFGERMFMKTMTLLLVMLLVGTAIALMGWDTGILWWISRLMILVPVFVYIYIILQMSGHLHLGVRS